VNYMVLPRVLATLLMLGCSTSNGLAAAQSDAPASASSRPVAAGDLAARCEALNLLGLETVGDAPGRIVATSLVIDKKATPAERIMFKKRGHSQGMPTPMLEAFPEHCLVEGYVTPHVRFNMVLPPPEKWNHRFMLAACDAWCGKLHPEIVVPGLYRGYATLTNDGGHYSRAPFDGIWAYHNIPARIDFAHRANHVTAQVGKAIAAAYYGSAPGYSYIVGFSKGGNAGLFAAQRYPEDFDGIFSKAPVPYYQWKNAAHFPWLARAVYPHSDDKPVMYSDKLPLVQKAVRAACDHLDGLTDGIIDDPRQCRFDPDVLLCRPGQPQDQCLTAEQVESVRRVYARPVDGSGKVYYDYPTDYGSEIDWARSIYPQPNSSELPFSLTGAITGLRYMVFEDDPGPTYDWRNFDYVKEAPRLRTMAAILDPDRLDLRTFKARGGKIIILHGWADAMVSASMTIDWFENMQTFMGGRQATAEFAQLYVVPGVQHGSGGSGPYVFDTQSALEKWVEQGIAPDSVLLEDEPGVQPFRTRPAFPYPAKARYKGRGDPNAASSFRRVEEAASAAAAPRPDR